MTYHGRVVGPGGKVYQCEHNHRTETAAIACANSSSTRRMAGMVWRRQALLEAQAAERARQREAARAAEQERRAAEREAAEKARAAREAKAERLKAEKRAAKLAAMKPERAWKKMTPEERLLKTAESELAVYGMIVTEAAQAAYAAKNTSSTLNSLPATLGDAKPDSPPGQTATMAPRPAVAVPPQVQRTDTTVNGRHARPENEPHPGISTSEPRNATDQISLLVREAGQRFSTASQRLKNVRGNPEAAAAINTELAGDIFTIAGKTEIYAATFLKNMHAVGRRLETVSAKPAASLTAAERDFIRAVRRLAPAALESVTAVQDFSTKLSRITGRSPVLDKALIRYQAQLQKLADMRPMFSEWQATLRRLDY